MKNQLNKTLMELCRTGLAIDCFSAVSAAVSMGVQGERLRVFFNGGMTRKDTEGREVTSKTLFDLASLTKPLCTTLCVLELLSAGKLSWDDSLACLFDLDLPADKKQIQLKHLLNHCSGWPAYRPYFQQYPPRPAPEIRDQLVEKIFLEPLVYQTGTTCQYSDLGFILLGALLERKSGMRLDALFQKQFTAPLQLSEDLRFFPLPSPMATDVSAIAATQQCPWRGKILQGEVDDEHCWLMGGVAGHAGLFGTAAAVLTLCELVLDIWKGGATYPALKQAVVQQALTSRHPTKSWCLGFDTPTPGTSSSGRYFSPCSVGHLGFSGTSFWIDPIREIVVVLLTNRIHPTRENTKIRQFRPFFHDRLMEAMDGCGEVDRSCK